MVERKMEFRRKQQIQFIMTQTNYDESEATQKLETCNNDVMKVVGEYLGINSVKKDENAKKQKIRKYIRSYETLWTRGREIT